jgi:putative sigma-54 modulation protein
MNLTMTGRHVTISERLKEYAEKKVSRLEKFFNQIIGLQMIVIEEKNQKKVELIIHADGAKLYASDEGDDFNTCIDTLIDKIDQQVKKYKDQQHNHKIKEKYTVPIVDLNTNEEEHISIVEASKKPIEIKEAYLEMKLDKRDYLLFKKDTEVNLNGIGYALLYKNNDELNFITAREENISKDNIASNYEFYIMKILEDSDIDPNIELEKISGEIKALNISQAIQAVSESSIDHHVFYNSEVSSLGFVRKNGSKIELAVPAE